VASTSSVVPGKPFEVALHMTMAPGWHSYYINPGESGQATTIKWNLPGGWRAGPIQWPAPERITVGGVAGYVYEGEVWLVTTITPSKRLFPGSVAPIGADVNWLLCREACVPQKSRLSLYIPPGKVQHKNWIFGPAEKSKPKPLADGMVSAGIQGKSAVLWAAKKAISAKSVEFFPADPTYFGADPVKTTTTHSGIKVVVPLSKYAPGSPSRLTGILVVPNGENKGAHWVDVKVTER
jgi:thiol:disulfide interchange protein DsbD